jgi:monothiol glutaredoxin
MADRITTDPPAPIAQLSAPEVKTLMEGGASFELVDVRTEGEYAVASIDGFRLLDKPYYDELLLRDRDTPLLFLCHHGIRSQGAAEHFQGEGFRRLYNLRGGIDAWSVLVDASVPRY